MKNLDWFSQAICSGKTELFFPPNYSENTRMRRRREDAALEVCRKCPVMLQCRDHARRNNELGVWGGETEDQRWRSGEVTVNSAIRRRRPAGYWTKAAVEARQQAREAREKEATLVDAE